MKYPSRMLLAFPLAASLSILAFIYHFLPDEVICPMGPMERKARWARWRAKPDGARLPDVPDGHICPMSPMGPMGIFARWARWTYLPDVPDGPIARWPSPIRQAMRRHDLNSFH